MSEISDRYARIADGVGSRVEGIGEHAWGLSTPCTEWTVRELVGHVVAVHRHVVAGLDASAPPAPAPDPDLTTAWIAATASVLAVLDDPERAATPVTGRFAPMPLEQVIGRLLCIDTLVHTWDLARATRQDERLDPVAVTIAFDGIRPADDAIRGAGGFGPKIEPSQGATEQTRFLCFLGRGAERDDERA
jgi:uncharacterized protein (TIGR03086 family)